MPKGGPRLNKISQSPTTRDSLGIEGVATSMQAEICPIVNTVTPRAFYWPFMIWIYYDFYKYSGIPDHTVTAFDAYLKRQDYFFVLATLLTEGSDQNNLVGKQQSQIDLDNDPIGPYPYNKDYFKTRYGGMQYYNAGCLSMYFITDEDPDSNGYLSFPKLRPEGEEMAKAFEAVIKDTEYYKSYRRNDEAVPRDVLLEYGKVINIGLKGFEKCKELLYHYMFEDDRAFQLKHRSQLLTDNGRYLKLIINENNVDTLNGPVCRAVLYDHLLPTGKGLIITDECKETARRWEIVVGRMYFTIGIEMFWKYMLELLNEPLTKSDWITQTFDQSDFNWDIKGTVSSVIEECNFNSKESEVMIAATASRNTLSYSIENGVKIILSVYDHFHERTDFGEEKAFFDYGSESQSISLSEMFETIELYKDKTLESFIVFIMQHWVIEQHYVTAYDKMIQGRDGFFYEIIDGRYIRKMHFGLDYQGIRLIQLEQVMRDLDML